MAATSFPVSCLSWMGTLAVAGDTVSLINMNYAELSPCHSVVRYNGWSTHIRSIEYDSPVSDCFLLYACHCLSYSEDMVTYKGTHKLYNSIQADLASINISDHIICDFMLIQSQLWWNPSHPSGLSPSDFHDNPELIYKKLYDQVTAGLQNSCQSVLHGIIMDCLQSDPQERPNAGG